MPAKQKVRTISTRLVWVQETCRISRFILNSRTLRFDRERLGLTAEPGGFLIGVVRPLEENDRFGKAQHQMLTSVLLAVGYSIHPSKTLEAEPIVVMPTGTIYRIALQFPKVAGLPF